MSTKEDHKLPFGIHIAFKYIRYIEGTEKLELEVEPMANGSAFIYLPSPERWQAEMPDWAKQRREEIVARIKEETKHLTWTWEEY